jgi:prephenate dehydrogenase
MVVGIAGLGVIGGSIGLALRQRAGVQTVLGCDLDPKAGEAALAAGCVTAVVNSTQDLAQSDVVFVAVPPQALRATLEALESAREGTTVVTDCTSIKGKAAEWAAQKETRASWFVGGHPMAGNEGSGAQFASAGLFDGAAWVLTPLGDPESEGVKTVEGLVRKFGAQPVHMSSEFHDKHVAVLSHFPHAVAAALLASAGGLDRPDIAGGSWRDLTRVAGSNPALWQHILLQNRDAVLAAMASFDAALAEFRTALQHNDGEALRAFFEEAKQSKKRQGGRP